MITLKCTTLCATIVMAVLATGGTAQASLTLGPPTLVAETAKTAKPIVKPARFTSMRATPRRARSFSPRFPPHGGSC